jgi:hypothetical protein
MFYTRGLTWQPSPKWYFVGLCWRFCYLSPCFRLWILWEMNWTPESRQFFPHLDGENHSHVCVLPAALWPTAALGEHSFLGRFPEFEAKRRKFVVTSNQPLKKITFLPRLELKYVSFSIGLPLVIVVWLIFELLDETTFRHGFCLRNCYKMSHSPQL